jgi:hypothetical protein
MYSTIDLETDDLIPIGQIVRDRLGRRLSPATIWRWRLKGVKAGNQTIRLEAVRVAGIWHTTAAAFAEFIRAQTEAATPTDDPPSERSDATKRQLEKAGLLK